MTISNLILFLRTLTSEQIFYVTGVWEFQLIVQYLQYYLYGGPCVQEARRC